MNDLPLDRAYHWEKTRPQEIFLTQPTNGVARDWTWAQAMEEARRMANHLIAQNWPAGSHIVIYSKNSAWWIMAELAIWMAGHVTVPIYPSLTAQSVRQLFEHCDAIACFVGPLDSHDPPRPNLYTICLPNAPPSEGAHWEEIVKTTAPLTTDTQRKPDEIATIIYTSGTTGTPKGAMHRFAAFPFLAAAVAQVTGEVRHRALSYLPLAHIAERSLTETTGIYYSWNVFFSENTATFLTDLKRARATVFFSVPRLYAKFQQKVFEKIPQQTLDRLLAIPGIKKALGKSLRHGMGLDHAAFAASGSAPLPRDLLQWFLALGLPLTEGYGTTETGITHTALHGESRPGYTGRNAPGVETKISEIGEVLLRSPMNMVGYYKNPEDTRQVFTEDDFLRTGDLGEQTSDGWLKITGRIKEQFKTAKGKYVAPSKIEALLSANAAVENCLVLGTNLAAPCAIVVLTEQALQSEKNALQKSFEDLLIAVNKQVEVHEHLALIALVNDHWTIETGFITPTLKLRRIPLEAYYGELLPAWLAEGKSVIWRLTAR